jgi:hypothetical protein
MGVWVIRRRRGSQTFSPGSALHGIRISLVRDNPQLTKTATPPMLVRAHEEWVASGADIINLPQGLHATRALSKVLGGLVEGFHARGLEEGG